LGFVGNSPKKKNQTMFSNGNGFCQPTTGKQESAGHFWCESWSHRRDMLKFVKIQSDFTCWILLVFLFVNHAPSPVTASDFSYFGPLVDDPFDPVDCS
jgi:hypothetical protein